MLSPPEPPVDASPAGVPVSTDFSALCPDVPHVGMLLVECETGELVEVNPTFCQMLGYSREELLARPLGAVSHPDDLPQSIQLFMRLREGSIPGYAFDKRYLRKDGEIVWFSFAVRKVSSPDTGIAYAQCVAVDNTERVRAEAEARAAAQLLDKFSQSIPGVFYQFQRLPDGRYDMPYASDGVHQLFGLASGVLLERPMLLFDRVHEDDVAAVLDSIESSAATLATWAREFRVRPDDRGVRWLRGEARPERRDDGSILWYGFLTDCTAWHEQQRALAASEQQLRFLFEHAAEGILLLDADTGRFVDVNPAAELLLGVSRAQLIGMSPGAVSASTQPAGETYREFIDRSIATVMGGEQFVSEWNARHADGHIIPCELRVTRLPVAGRQLLRATIVDISDRRRARVAMERLQQAIDSSMNGVAIAEPDGRLAYVNRAFLNLWGYGSSEVVLGRSALTFWRSVDEAQAVMQALFEHGSWSGELKAPRADGRERTFQLNASAIRDADSSMLGILASFADVTETRRLQEELNQSQKLESIGRLAGGVAHDFNNLLTVIKASLDLALSELPSDSMARVDLREVGRAADSAARLTQQLLAFSRKQVIAPTVLNLNDVVARISGMLQRLLGEDISLQTSTAPDLGAVRFDAGQAEQVLVNLAVNARDAMPRGGVLTIETRNVHLDADFARLHPGVRPDDYVLLTVSDTGAGMSQDVLSHAFEPFFTTKDAGKGTGLGLAVIHGAVTQNGGRVDVRSVVGVGTTFHIYLPRVVASPASTEREPVLPLPRGDEVILLVEDDAAVRQLITRLLVQQGYRVFAFESGALALTWLETTTEHVHLLFTDVIMPGMNGRELAEQVLARRPGTRLLYASGYTANVIADHGILDSDTPYLAKPFSIRELALKVREAIAPALVARAVSH